MKKNDVVDKSKFEFCKTMLEGARALGFVGNEDVQKFCNKCKTKKKCLHKCQIWDLIMFSYAENSILGYIVWSNSGGDELCEQMRGAGQIIGCDAEDIKAVCQRCKNQAGELKHCDLFRSVIWSFKEVPPEKLPDWVLAD